MVVCDLPEVLFILMEHNRNLPFKIISAATTRKFWRSSNEHMLRVWYIWNTFCRKPKAKRLIGSVRRIWDCYCTLKQIVKQIELDLNEVHWKVSMMSLISIFRNHIWEYKFYELLITTECWRTTWLQRASYFGVQFKTNPSSFCAEGTKLCCFLYAKYWTNWSEYWWLNSEPDCNDSWLTRIREVRKLDGIASRSGDVVTHLPIRHPSN
jgi:hypothetical protein